MSKANTIRKRALEHARNQKWDAAIREYEKLAEIDVSNPNLFNELGDIYLKTGEKNQAYESFVKAIDSYTRVSLHNNAVAVCKKVLRLIPARYEVQGKLGIIRMRQGLAKEAESYCLSYLSNAAQDANIDGANLTRMTEEIAEVLPDCASVLDRAADLLLANRLEEEAGAILARLHGLYDRDGIDDAKAEVAKKLDELGLVHLLTAGASKPTKDGAVITEENIWTDSHSEGERIDVGGGTGSQGDDVEPMAGPDPGSDAGYDVHTVSLSGDTPPPSPVRPRPGAAIELPDVPADEVPATGASVDLDEEPEAETDAAENGAKEQRTPAPSHESIHVSAIIDENDDRDTEADDSDHRSHYDLGMAYLEMNLFAEAVREFQLASRSQEYQIKSLEMIGLCFLRQNQAHLAIKQLTRGLQQIDDSDQEALGIRYNLGLAYEMAGETDKARVQFEDVYVVDVTFRDVAEKVAQHAR